MAFFKSFFKSNQIDQHTNNFERGKRNVYVDLNTYLRFFQLFGLDVCKNNNYSKKKTFFIIITRNLTKLIWLILLVLLLSNFCNILYNNIISKKSLIEIFVLLPSILTWYNIANNHAQITKSLRKLQTILRMLKIQQPKKIIWIVFLFLIFTLIFYIFVDVKEDNKEKIGYMVYKRFTFGKVDNRTVNWYIMACVAHVCLSGNTYAQCFQLYFAGLYVIVCRYMVLTLYRHIRLSKYIRKSSNLKSTQCDQCFFRFHSIMEMLRILNSVFSYPIFVTICKIFTVFLINFRLAARHQVDIVIFLFLLIDLITFTAITFAASAVNDLSERAKNNNVEILWCLDTNERSRAKEKFETLLLMCQAPAYSLDAWGCFQFTKGFYLSAIGCLMTYCFLINQM